MKRRSVEQSQFILALWRFLRTIPNVEIKALFPGIRDISTGLELPFGPPSTRLRKVLYHPFVAEGMKVLHLHFGGVKGVGLRVATQMLSRLAKEARWSGKFRSGFY